MKKYVKRYLSLMLTLALVISIPFAFTQEASAASKKGKTKYVVKSEANVQKNENNTNVSTTEKYEYYKNGLLKSKTDSEGSKEIFKRNKKGYVIQKLRYDEKGQLSGWSENTYKYNKKGLPIKMNVYDVSEGKKELSYSVAYTYYKKGALKKEVITYPEGGSETTVFNKKGNITDRIYSDKNYTSIKKHALKYDKNGNLINDTNNITWKDGTYTGSKIVTESFRYTYGKKKTIKRSVNTVVVKYDTGETETEVSTTQFTYKKAKVPKKYTKVFNIPDASTLSCLGLIDPY